VAVRASDRLISSLPVKKRNNEADFRGESSGMDVQNLLTIAARKSATSQ
jgi:hypothetical protein